MAYLNPIEIQFPASSLDAFARQRIAEPATIFDSKLTSDNRPLIWDDAEVSGSGTTSIYNVNTSSNRLNVAATTAGRRIRQTFRRFNYQPGKSQLVILTGIIGAPTSGNSKKLGYFDDNNGLFFDSTNTDVGVNVRTFTTGAATETRIAQSSWNIDKLDGTGASGVTLDFSKTQIFFFDFEWLGVGSVRFGFFIDGMPIYCHVVQNANVLTEVYMTTPNLPIRFEIENDGSGASDSIKQICSTVISEGGVAQTGAAIAIDRGTTALQTSNNSNLYPLFAIRLKAGYFGSTVQVNNFSIICTSNSAYNYEWLLDPTVAGIAFSFSSLPNSSIEVDASRLNTTTVTGGTLLNSGVGFQSNQGGSTQANFRDEFALGSSISGTPQIAVLAIRRLTGTSETFYSSVNLTDQK